MTTSQKNLVFHDHLKNDLVFHDHFKNNLAFHDHLNNNLVFHNHLNNYLVFHDQMLGFTTGDDFPNLIEDNIDEGIAYIREFANLQSEIISPQVASSQAASPVVAPLKKKRIRIRKGVWSCTFCKSTFSSKQNLEEHMENIRICVKKQKRLSEEEITLAPHEDLGSTLQSCVETLRQHQRLNEPLKAK